RCCVCLTKQGDRIWLSIDPDRQDWVSFLEAIECSPPIAGTRLTGNQRHHRKVNEVMLIKQPKQVLNRSKRADCVLCKFSDCRAVPLIPRDLPCCIDHQ